MGQQVPSHNVVLYGTEETDEPGRLLRAGALTVEFHNGQIRYVRMGRWACFGSLPERCSSARAPRDRVEAVPMHDRALPERRRAGLVDSGAEPRPQRDRVANRVEGQKSGARLLSAFEALTDEQRRQFVAQAFATMNASHSQVDTSKNPARRVHGPLREIARSCNVTSELRA